MQLVVPHALPSRAIERIEVGFDCERLVVQKRGRGVAATGCRGAGHCAPVRELAPARQQALGADWIARAVVATVSDPPSAIVLVIHATVEVALACLRMAVAINGQLDNPGGTAALGERDC